MKIVKNARINISLKSSALIFGCAICLYLFLFACDRARDEADRMRLQRWNAVCDSIPAAIADSLKTMNSQKLSRENHAWYGLLKTITDDKTYVDFSSDSLIDDVENYFRRHDKQSRNHIRSLIYQGIVRSRMGIADSTVYEPLKEAIVILSKQKNPDVSSLYFANYYLGDIHMENRNNDLALRYFQQALACAKQKNSLSYFFEIYLKIFWMKMFQEEYIQAESYLDTLAFYSRTPDNKYFLLNAEAVYHDTREEYRQAIQKEKEQLSLTTQIKEKIEFFKIYYSLSTRYRILNQLDSAMYCAQQAITHIQDSSYQYNYRLYDNAADIASAMGNYRLADEYRAGALEAYGASVEKRLDTQILELEKQYDLSEAENKALKAKARFNFSMGIGLLVLLFVIMLVLYSVKQRKIERLKREKLTGEKNRMETEKQLSEAEALLLRRQAENQRQMLSRYVSFLKLHASQQQHIRSMANKVRAKNASLGDVYEEMLKAGQQQFTGLVNELFTTEDIRRVFGIHDQENILNKSDRLLLFMLANESDNDQIAALLNTTPHNLKSKKSYLKKKIAAHVTPQNGYGRLLELF